jgi:hypothetical protein
MGLDEIEGIRADIKKLKDEREVNIREAKESILNIKTRYNSLLKKEGEEYCTKNCSDIPTQINKLAQEFSAFYNQ